jgi:CRP/FNR family transcriptional regulator, cyclic AMP receptor protein
MAIMQGKETRFDPKAFFERVWEGRTIAEYRKNQVVFVQGDAADDIYYIQQGKVKLTVLSKTGKQAVIAILGASDFFGEGCLTGQPFRISNATPLTACSIVRICKEAMIRILREELAFSEVFTAYLLSRIIRLEEDLVDQLFNSSEKRLARVLLLLANSGKEQNLQPIIPPISQEILAEMVGTTRPRVNFFLNKFRKLGFIEYNGGLKVHSSLLNIVLHD